MVDCRAVGRLEQPSVRIGVVVARCTGAARRHDAANSLHTVGLDTDLSTAAVRVGTATVMILPADGATPAALIAVIVMAGSADPAASATAHVVVCPLPHITRSGTAQIRASVVKHNG
eukprot:SAG11_NODE_3766_length_2240_cov_2.968239_2_plen_117_part_00